MGKTTSFSVGEHFNSFIQAQIESGRYASSSEVIRAGLRLLEEEEEKRAALKKALIAGEESGFVADFDPQTFRENLKRRSHSRKGAV
ncbi:MAG: type II toxin-antitoxin system ParD family antitoxin [Siphonobacter aquaeclarae]|nr:type II toxin-antitoxin system ParD family antitoxin [Siphonobacter aquaeclarae]